MATPVCRGQCDACGHSRNLWVSELARYGNTGTPCDHGGLGCEGSLVVVYRGPKAWIPESCLKRCSCQGKQAAGAGGGGAGGGGGVSRGALPRPPNEEDGRFEEDIPAAPSSFPGLQGQGEEELEALEASLLLTDDFLHEHATAVARLVGKVGEVRAENRRIAESLASSAEELRVKAEESQRRRQRLEAGVRAVQALSARSDLLARQRSPELLAATLAERARAADGEAEGELQDALAEEAPALDAEALVKLRQAYVGRKMQKHRRLALREKLGAAG